jgi:hypothetical protein
LKSAERRLLLRATLLLWAIRVGLLTLRFQALRRFLASVPQPPAGVRAPGVLSPDRIAWCVEAAGRYVPGARTCLNQALAAQALLKREGHPASLRIGVSRGEGGQLKAHAWVESQGRVVVGGAGDLSRYAPLPALAGKRR